LDTPDKGRQPEGRLQADVLALLAMAAAAPR
jgi:hypothetical protein